METSYLKAHPLGNRYPEWTPNLRSDRSQDSNPCARGFQGLQSTSGSTVPLRLSHHHFPKASTYMFPNLTLTSAYVGIKIVQTLAS